MAGVIPERAAVKDITPGRGCIGALGRFLLDAPLGAPVVEKLRRDAGPVVEFYNSRDLRKSISGWVGADVMPTPVHDRSSCSVLIYANQGDHIGWHYDYNFYEGRHFTALLSLVNEHRLRPGLSSANLRVRKNGLVQIVSTPPNTFVLFEGAYIYHGVTALGPDERRIILSMTFCTNPATTPLKDFARRS